MKSIKSSVNSNLYFKFFRKGISNRENRQPILARLRMALSISLASSEGWMKDELALSLWREATLRDWQACQTNGGSRNHAPSDPAYRPVSTALKLKSSRVWYCHPAATRWTKPSADLYRLALRRIGSAAVSPSRPVRPCRLDCAGRLAGPSLSEWQALARSVIRPAVLIRWVSFWLESLQVKWDKIKSKKLKFLPLLQWPENNPKIYMWVVSLLKE